MPRHLRSPPRTAAAIPTRTSGSATRSTRPAPYSCPKDNIERSIKKGTGELGAENFEEVIYEGYGPGGVAVLCEVLTDNRNRTAGELRKAFEVCGGNLGASGCVSYLFNYKGLFVIDAKTVAEDALMEVALEAGADDIQLFDGFWEVTCDPKVFEAVRKALEDRTRSPSRPPRPAISQRLRSTSTSTTASACSASATSSTRTTTFRTSTPTTTSPRKQWPKMPSPAFSADFQAAARTLLLRTEPKQGKETFMKYFRPDLFVRSNSRDIDEAMTASDEWESSAKAYRKHLKRISGRLPGKAARFVEEVYLHDAEFLGLDLERPDRCLPIGFPTVASSFAPTKVSSSSPMNLLWNLRFSATSYHHNWPLAICSGFTTNSISTRKAITRLTKSS